MEKEVKFEDAPPITGTSEQKPPLEPAELSQTEQKKDPALQDLLSEAGQLELKIEENSARLRELHSKIRRKEFDGTPEGKLAALQINEMKEAQLRQNAALIERIAHELLLAKRARALEILADEYLKRHHISENDRRVQELIVEIRETRTAIAGLHFNHNHSRFGG